MYQVVPGGAGGTVTNAKPIKQKLKRDARPLVVVSVLGLVLVISAVITWCYYIGSLRKEGEILSCWHTSDRKLKFFIQTVFDNTVQCYRVHCEELVLNLHVEHAMTYNVLHWYGGAETSIQHCPISIYGQQAPKPFVTSEIDSNRSGFGGILERYWLSFNATDIKINDSVPFHLGWNDTVKTMYFQARFHDTPYKPNPGEAPCAELRYRVCVGLDVTSIHKYMVCRYFQKPNKVPSKTDIDQEKLLKYVANICKHRFNHLELDDRYTNRYGEFELDSAKFPNATAMLQKLKADGFLVSLWTHPLHKNTPSSQVPYSHRAYHQHSRLPVVIERDRRQSLSEIERTLPDRELDIRCLESSVFMPSIEVVEIHESIVGQRVLKLAGEVLDTGDPIIRPLWWISTGDKTAYKIDSKFLIGDDLMVAPVLEPGKQERDIYLPAGHWQSYKGELFDIKEPLHLMDYLVDLDEIAYFVWV
uniref:Myosis regulating glycosidase n=1 Tax=Hucho hucho TaxID=62062 RepID=A0A4W5P5S4_9TELE